MPVLAYLVVSQPELSTPDIQKILVGIGSEEVVLDAATITVYNESTGEYLDYAATILTGGAALFEIAYSEGQSGAYTLSSLRYTYNGVETALNFAEIGIEARYGVNTEVATDPDDVAVSEDEAEPARSGADVELEVSTINEAGELETANSIEDAMAAGDSLESGIMTMALDNDAASNGRATSKNGNIVVVLDPGHDSTHAGAQANRLSEETLNLKIAQYCKAELETYAGVTVYMTRNAATCPHPGTTSTDDNAARVAYAASVDADYYVSIHINSFEKSSTKGAEVYYPNANYATNTSNPEVNSGVNLNKEGSALAQSILDQLVKLGLGNRGIKIRDSESGDTYNDGSLCDYYGVIRRSKQAGICGIIVEHCFITNTSDAGNYLSSDSKLKSLGVADATGIANYLGLSKGSTTTNKPSTPILVSAVNTGSRGITVTWKAVSGATEYRVCRIEKGQDWNQSVRVATIRNANTVSYLDTTAKAGVTYIYTVRAANGNSLSSFDATGLSVVRLVTPTLVSAANTGSRGITVTWKAVSGATEYRVCRIEKGQDWNQSVRVATIRNANTVSYLDTTAKAGVTYIYTVRAANGSCLSSYDATGLSTTLAVLVPVSATINSNSRAIWNYLINAGLTPAGAAGLMGNLDAESSMNPQNLEGRFEKQLYYTDANGKMTFYTDATYTAAVNNGTYRYGEYDNARDSFSHDYVGSTSGDLGAGYGLAQWTWWSHKRDLYDYATARGKSVGDLQTQLGFLVYQLSTQENFPTKVWKVLTTTDDVMEASNVVLLYFERPADQSEAVQYKRAGKGLTYYNKYA